MTVMIPSVSNDDVSGVTLNERNLGRVPTGMCLGLYHAAPHGLRDTNLIDLSRMQAWEVSPIINSQNVHEIWAVSVQTSETLDMTGQCCLSVLGPPMQTFFYIIPFKYGVCTLEYLPYNYADIRQSE